MSEEKTRVGWLIVSYILPSDRQLVVRIMHNGRILRSNTTYEMQFARFRMWEYYSDGRNSTPYSICFPFLAL